ncbi:E3 SUMO-protein ligase pli1 [Naganishia albida]|nr:E3 SUMO-protein ligase pli1 [Naganishia albida]
MATSAGAFAGLDTTHPSRNFAFQDFVQRTIPNVTVDKLKQAIDQLNLHHRQTIGPPLKKHGRKAELVASLQDAIRAFRRLNHADQYRQFRASWESIVAPWTARSTPTFAKTVPTATSYGASSSTAGQGAYGSYLNGAPSAYGSGHYGGAAAATAVAPRYTIPQAVTSYNLISWKSTPGWKAIKALSDIYLLPAIEDGHNAERRNKIIALIMNQVDLDAINAPVPPGQPKKEIRLFCTSSDYYPTCIAAGQAAPLEFPYNSEITVDSRVVTYRKGLKGRANTAAPVALDGPTHPIKKYNMAQSNISMTHVGPSLNKKTKEPKKFFFQICLTEITPFAEMQRKIINGRKKTKAEILAGMKASAAEDDIQLGSTKVSLKDPISYTRILNPARSDFCSHVQCFDVAQWVSVNETTPQYQCPTCERELQMNQIFIDGYFESILAACPDFVDEVIIEPDGEWHTEDNKYASPGWRSQQAEAAASKANTPVEEKPRSSLQNGSSSAGSSTDAQKETHTAGDTRANASRMQEVVALDDSDDDDEPPLKHITKPAVRRILSGDSDERGSVDRLVEDALGQHSANASRSSESGPGSALAAAAEPVIDLTLTDDEEELAGPVLPSWAADIPALAKADKRERSMSSMMEAEDRVALRRRLASNGLSEHNPYEPGFRSNATSPIPPISVPPAAGPWFIQPEGQT